MSVTRSLGRFIGVAGVAGMVLSGCKTDSAERKASSSPAQSMGEASSPSAAATSAPAYRGPAGSVSGSISFAGKPPAPVLIDTSMDPACALNGEKVYSEQIVVNSGKLANVFVYVKSGPPAAMQAGAASTMPVVLDQKGCQYVPHVIGVVQGGSVEFRNSDPTMHNIHTLPSASGNQTIDVSQGPKGTSQTKQFQKPETMIPVLCNNHPWMNGFINVSQTPFFAVTDSSGHFDLKGLPPGDYVLGAKQEKLGEKTMNVTIKPDATAKAEFRFAAK